MAASGHNHARQAPSPPLPLTGVRAGRRGKAPSNSEELELRLAALERERREFHQELFDAAQVQRRLSGPRQCQRGLFDIASEVFPVRHLAGDFVTTLDIGDRTWIAMGDISGKGLAAAMWFTHLVSLIRCYAARLSNPAAVLTEINADLCRLQPAPPLTSMVVLVLDGDSGRLEYCNAGHPAPLLLRAGQVERLETGGPLLGVVNGAPYASATLQLAPGEMLVGFTDGVVECRNRNDEEFAFAGLLREARKSELETAQAVLFHILGAVQDFAASAPRNDDVSLLVVRAANHWRSRAETL